MKNKKCRLERSGGTGGGRGGGEVKLEDNHKIQYIQMILHNILMHKTG